MKHLQQGFTLIELMIVVAIIGILAAIGLPAYQDYTKRAYVSEGLSLASAAKTAVTEYYASQGLWPTTNTEAGMVSSTSIISSAVKSVAVGPSGVVTITYAAKVKDGTQVALTPTDNQGSISWVCATTASNGVPSKWLPKSCL